MGRRLLGVPREALFEVTLEDLGEQDLLVQVSRAWKDLGI